MESRSLPHTPQRHTYGLDTSHIPLSPIVLEIERQLLFTPDRQTSTIKPSTSLDSLATYAYTGYSPRPDDFYFDDGDGGYVTKLELPEDEREVVVAEEFLKDIRRLEDAIEHVQAIDIPQADQHLLDLAKLEETERILMQHLASLEVYESANYRTLRDACMESVLSPRKRDKSCVSADKVSLYALGVTAEMAINTLREECYRRLDQVHMLMCAVHGTAAEDLVAETQDGDALPHASHSNRAETPSKIPRSSRRRMARTETSDPPETVPNLARSGSSRHKSLAERLNQSVQRTAGEVLTDSSTQLSFQPEKQMKIWSDGISGMCTFTFQGKTASAYCRMWTRDNVLRVSVVVGGGFQSLDEWLERTFKRHSTMLKPATEAAVTSSPRKHALPLHGITLPASIPASISMPTLAQSSIGTPSKPSHSARRTPTSFLDHDPFPSSPRSPSVRRTSMLRNVSASSTYQLSDDVVKSIEKSLPEVGRGCGTKNASPSVGKAHKEGLPVSGSNRSNGLRTELQGSTTSPLKAYSSGVQLT